MIDVESKVTADCNICDKNIDLEKDDIIICCEKCIEKKSIEEMIITMKEVLEQKQLEDFDGYVGFENNQEKKAFMKGIKEGMSYAFFWYSNMYGDEGVKAFEELESLFSVKNS